MTFRKCIFVLCLLFLIPNCKVKCTGKCGVDRRSYGSQWWGSSRRSRYADQARVGEMRRRL